jgi:hypothetical protein
MLSSTNLRVAAPCHRFVSVALTVSTTMYRVSSCRVRNEHVLFCIQPLTVLGIFRLYIHVNVALVLCYNKSQQLTLCSGSWALVA